MNKFQSLCLGATLAATTMTTVALAPSSALAITLNGNISISGPVALGTPASSPATSLLDFVTGSDGKEGAVDTVTHDFATFVPTLLGKRIDIVDLFLTRITGSLASLSADYSFGAVANFIDFGTVTLGTTTANLSFDLDAGVLNRTRKPLSGNIVEVTPNDPGLTGKFQFNGETVAIGEISATQTIFGGVTGGSATISLSAKPVPEPLTMGGLALGTAFGAFMRKRYSKNDAKLQKA
jgi:PEP-CTERM motif